MNIRQRLRLSRNSVLNDYNNTQKFLYFTFKVKSPEFIKKAKLFISKLVSIQCLDIDDFSAF